MTVVDAGDHAFANGPVYRRPSSWLDAIALTRSARAGRRLRAVWRQFDRASVGPDVKLSLLARLVNLDDATRVRVDSQSVVRGILRNEPGGRIDIESMVYVGDGVLLSAAVGIRIGSETLVAHGVQIFDNDTHPVQPEARTRHFRHILGLPGGAAVEIGKAPVDIGRRCWIGLNSLVMKGVAIGDDSVVAAGSVVTSDVPARSLAAGNPARVVKSL